MNKLIIFGSNGMLGTYIHSYFKSKIPSVITINRDTYDVMTNSIDVLNDIFNTYNIDDKTVVFNAIGTIPQASKNHNIDDRMYIKVNAIFPNTLATLCKWYGAHLIHPTTDCVYSGCKGGYTETDLHDALSLYGQTKSLGEPENCTVIRCSIIGEELRNKRSLVEWVKSNKDGEIDGYTNHYWNGITCLQYAKLIEKIISSGNFWQGVRHITSPLSVSKYELVSMINNAYELGIKINPHETLDHCDRTLAFNNRYDFKIPPLEEQIRDMASYKLI